MTEQEARFERARRELGPAIRAALQRFVQEADRPDVEADIMASIWTAVLRFRGESALKTYLYPIVRRRVHDYFRGRYRERRLQDRAQERLLEVRRPAPDWDPAVELTGAELRVFRLLARGPSNEELARMLRVTKDTVRTHVKALYGKTRAADRAKLVLLAGRFYKEDS